MARLKPVEWIGSSRDDIRSFPDEVREVVGEALYRAQQGSEHPAAKALKGFGAAACSKLWMITVAIHIARSTRSNSRMRSMCCTLSRRNRRRGLGLPDTRSI